ncbi:MAG: FkbM family methyltransferase, partial [Burkholderiaceae bacterium]|nr:FkbM family methyltransferase [Burkholderiaceae bacterium]
MIISYAQNFEDVMLWRALKQIEIVFYIDVVENDPIIDSVTQLFYENNWHGVNIEPLASHWQALQHNRLRDTNIQCAVGEFDGEIKLWECDVRGWATADEEVIAHHVSNGHSGHYTTIPQTTLNQIWLQHALSEVHFLKVDVEGFERSVLKGLDLQRFRPWIVVVEATKPNTTLEVHDQWEPLLLMADYLFVYADGLNRFYVACEHHELVPAFRYPPNVFDHFVNTPHMEHELWAQTLATRVTQAEARTSIALAHVVDADARIESLLKSASWRLTGPLRMVSSRLRGRTPHFSMRRLPNLAAGIVRYIASHSVLRKIGEQVLISFPATKSRIKNLVRSARVTVVSQQIVPVKLA